MYGLGHTWSVLSSLDTSFSLEHDLLVDITWDMFITRELL